MESDDVHRLYIGNANIYIFRNALMEKRETYDNILSTVYSHQCTIKIKIINIRSCVIMCTYTYTLYIRFEYYISIQVHIIIIIFFLLKYLQFDTELAQ
jgi:hypothetical protein